MAFVAGWCGRRCILWVRRLAGWRIVAVGRRGSVTDHTWCTVAVIDATDRRTAGSEALSGSVSSR